MVVSRVQSGEGLLEWSYGLLIGRRFHDVCAGMVVREH